MDWLEVTVYTTTQGIEPVSGNLYQLGITGLEIEDEADFHEFLEQNHQYWDYVDDELMQQKAKETCVKAYVSDNASGNEMLLSIRQAMQSLREYDKDGEFGRLEIEIGSLSEEDWANNWKKFFHPMEIGKKIMIKPEWEELSTPNDRLVFNINPGMTFGTGSHYTTQLCIEEMEDFISSDTDVLDLGCGSGILSVIALMLGAKSATAVDIDPNCIDIAYANAKRNNVDTSKYEVLSGDVTSDDKLLAHLKEKKYPVVLANIVADVIMAITPTVAECISDDGVFISSGIILDRLDEVKQQLIENGFEINKVSTRKDWACIVSRKKG